MVDINKPWYIKITSENYDIILKWWDKSAKCLLNRFGICGMYLDTKDILYRGQTEGTIKKGHFDFGNEITLEEFKMYILEEYIKIYELW